MGGHLPPRRARQPESGDVVVTKVVHHYHIGRLREDGEAVTAIVMADDRAEGLALARDAVTGRQRVFLYDRAGTRDFVEIDCAKRH